MRKLRKQIKMGMALAAAAAAAFLLPVEKETPALHLPAGSEPSVIPEEIESFTKIQEPVSLKDYQKLNSAVKYLLVFEEEREERRIPVIATNDSSYALTHDLLGREESAGTAFTDAVSHDPMNLVIYGHSSSYRDVQFTFLKNMKEEEYYDTHPVFLLESEEGQFPCQVVSMGEYDLGRQDITTDWALPEYQNVEAVQQMFQSTVPNLLQHTDGIVYQGQQIITLVTCNMDQTDTRYVLQALRL